MRTIISGLGIALFALVQAQAGVTQVGYQSDRGSPTVLNDFASDWTALSPRRECFHFEGLKDNLLSSPRVPPEELQHSLGPRLERNLDEFAAHYESVGHSPQAFGDYISVTIRGIGRVGAMPNVDRRRMAVLAERLGSIETPSAAGDTNQTTQAVIERECALEYIAVAFGVGRPDGEARYAKIVSAWRTSTKMTKPTYYPRALVSMNYLVARERLARGDEIGAFQLAHDPVMDWGIVDLQYVTNWRASFYQFGIGTTKSIPKAISVYEIRPREPGNIIEGAILKASVGRKAEAATQLKAFMEHEWNGSREYQQANDAYRAITGAQYREPNMFEMLIALPLGIAAYCFNNAEKCPRSNGTVFSTSQNESEIDRRIRDERQLFQSIMDFNEVQTWKF